MFKVADETDNLVYRSADTGPCQCMKLLFQATPLQIEILLRVSHVMTGFKNLPALQSDHDVG